MSYRNVLVLAYYFPPMGLSGVQRTLKFVKYLPLFGWMPTVLTVRSTRYFAFDPSLLSDLSEGISVVRTESLDPLRVMRLLSGSRGLSASRSSGIDPPEGLRHALNLLSQVVFQPDNKVGWIPFALGEARRQLSVRDFGLIYSTAPPFSSHIAGWLAKRATGTPLVLDFRDPWTDNQFARYPTPLHLEANRAMERQILKDADAVITTNGRMTAALRGKLRSTERSKFRTIPHGFDPEDFERIVGDESGKTARRKFTITYTGAFYDRLTPRYFLEALRALLDEHPEIEHELRVVFVGMFRRENERMVRDLKLEGIVEVTSYVEHSESVRRLMDSDLTWFMIGDGRGAEMWSPGKLFEYIACRKPILACVPEGTAADTVRATGNGTIVPPDDVLAIKDALFAYYCACKKGNLRRTSGEIVRRYDRRNLAGELASLFDAVVERRIRS